MLRKIDSRTEVRLKEYENKFNATLSDKKIIIVRLDGVNFAAVKKGFKSAFDDVVTEAMKMTAFDICKNITAAKFAYTFSDEITLVMRSDLNWYCNRVNKIVSVTASMATRLFNKYFIEYTSKFEKENAEFDSSVYKNKFFNIEFDSRAFSIDLSDLYEELIWRQRYAELYAIQHLWMEKHHNKSIKLESYNKNYYIDMLNKDANAWENLEIKYKRGIVIYRKKSLKIDENPPEFENRPEYLKQKLVFFEQNYQ